MQPNPVLVVPTKNPASKNSYIRMKFESTAFSPAQTEPSVTSIKKPVEGTPHAQWREKSAQTSRSL